MVIYLCVIVWCHQRESNLRLRLTKSLLYHLTMAAFVVGGRGLEPLTPSMSTRCSTN